VRVTIDLPDEIVQAIAVAVVERMARQSSPDGSVLLGWRQAGVSCRTWRKAVATGQLKALRIGRELKAQRQDVAAWLATLAQPVRLTPVAKSVGGDVDAEIDHPLANGRLRRVK
jgi:DUF917 family protein